MRRAPVTCFVGLIVLATAWARVTAAPGDEIDDDLAAIAAAGQLGTGSDAARAARDRLAQRGPDVLPRLLAATDGAGAVALNWYRTAFDQIVAHELQRPEPALPHEALRAFVLDPKHQGKVRRLVLRVLDRIDPEFRGQTLPGLLDDPEFRGEAVALALAAGDQAQTAGDRELARQRFQAAFQHARDPAQITAAADRLRGLGEEASVVQRLGLVVDWWLLGPFDAPGFSGFGLSFPPEQQVDLAAVYSGQNGNELAWQRHATGDGMGQVNLIQAIGPAGEAVGYAYAEIDVPAEQVGQVRCGADDNVTVWLNGEKVLAREQWLNGTRFDRFRAPVTLRAGRNRLLVKVCQGPQHKDPAVPNNWSLQLRLCDETGAGVTFQSALPPVEE
jgi:hypothetical protein